MRMILAAVLLVLTTGGAMAQTPDELKALPDDVWKRVLQAVVSPTWAGAVDLALELRAEIHPDDPLTLEHAAFHAPGVGLDPRR